jgi:NSS family neurotransmitter:Na+ symporter
MADQSSESREHWSGILGFILAAVGSAVGLGNIWRFPFITGRYGGGAFVLVYLLSVVVIGLPLLIAEMKVGRRSQKGPVGAFASLGRDAFGGKAWKIFGLLAILTGFVLLSYYSVVGGWTFGYSIKALYGQLAGSPEQAGAYFGQFIGDEVQVTMAHALFMIAVIGIVYSGVSDGIERATRILMPLFGVLLVSLFAYAMTTAGAGDAFAFMFEPRWNQIGVEAILAAVGQACFTLSIGMGAIIVYGSYLNKDDPIYSSSLTVAVSNTSVSLIAALVIFSTLFTEVDIPWESPLLESYQGAGLAFQVMPKLFAQIPGGAALAAGFFLLLAFAAISSAISLLEVVVSYFIEEYDVGRARAAVWCGIAILFMGIPSAIGFNLWSEVTPIGSKNILSSLDHLVVNYALPLGVLGVAGYAGWAVERDEWLDEIASDPWSDLLFDGWIWLVRIVSPSAVVVILLSNVGLVGGSPDPVKAVMCDSASSPKIIEIGTEGYTPSKTKLQAGDVVKWTNRTSESRVVRHLPSNGERSRFRSYPLDDESASCLEFKTPGTYRFGGSEGTSGQTGTVEVTESTQSESSGGK